MSNQLRDIYRQHRDTEISVQVGNQKVFDNLMSMEAFVTIVSKLVKTTSTGLKHNNMCYIK